MSNPEKRVLIDDDGMYQKGKMTTFGYTEAELMVDTRVPRMEVIRETPLIHITANGVEYELHHGNTRVSEYGEDFSHMDHIYHHTGEHGVYMFNEPGDPDDPNNQPTDMDDMVAHLHDRNFPAETSECPSERVMEAYYDYCRGETPIEDVLAEIALRG